jgi:hypothetical protein
LDGIECKYRPGDVVTHEGVSYQVVKTTNSDFEGCVELEVVSTNTGISYLASLDQDTITRVFLKPPPKRGVQELGVDLKEEFASFFDPPPQRGGALPTTEVEQKVALSHASEFNGIVDLLFKSNTIHAIAAHISSEISPEKTVGYLLKDKGFMDYITEISKVAEPKTFKMFLAGYHTLDDWTIFPQEFEKKSGDFIRFKFTEPKPLTLICFVSYTKRKTPTEAIILSELTRQAKEGIPRIVVAAHTSELRTPPNAVVGAYTMTFPAATPPPAGKECKYKVGDTVKYDNKYFTVTKTIFGDVGCVELELTQSGTRAVFHATIADNAITGLRGGRRTRKNRTPR